MIKKELVKKTAEFYEFYNDYYMSKHSDEDITDYTTQAYYNNMHVERKRLEERGLRLETIFLPDQKAAEGSSKISHDGNNYIGVDENPCVCQRNFYRNGRKIYSDKSHEIVRTSLIGYAAKGDAECPNCGHTNKISSYVNGCDYCGSKYEVKEFEPKVSAFGMNENLPVVAEETKKFGFNFAKWTVVIMITTFVLGIIFSIITQVKEINSNIPRYMVLYGGYLREPIVRFLIAVVIAFFAIAFAFKRYKRTAIANADVVQNVIKRFSAEDFFQHIEMKLNLIYLALRVSSVQSFASEDLKDMVEAHLDVVDSHMVSLTFNDVEKVDDAYKVSATAAMRLYSFVNGRIRKSGEQVDFTVLVDKDTFKNNHMTIKAYKCCKCGNNIDVNRGSCEYCGHELELQDVKFKFEKIRWKRKNYEMVPKMLGAFIGVFLGVFAINMLIPNATLGGENMWNAVKVINSIETIINDIYDTAILPEYCLATDKVKLVSKQVFQNDREYVYDIVDSSVFEDYKQALKGRRYRIDEKREHEFVATYYKAYEELGDVAYLTIKVTEYTNRMVLVITME